MRGGAMAERRVLVTGGAEAVLCGPGEAMPVEKREPELADESELGVFEIILPITICVLSDDEFFQDEAQEPSMMLPQLKEVKQEPDVLESSVRPSDNITSPNVWEGNNMAASRGSGMKHPEEEWAHESVCNSLKLSISDWTHVSKGVHGALSMLPCKTEPAEVNEASDRKQCDVNDSFEKIPLLSAADSKGRDEGTCEQMILKLTALCRDEELADVPSVRPYGSQEEQLEVHKEMGTLVGVKDTDSSKNGDDEANNKASKGSKFEGETLPSVLEQGLKKEGPEEKPDLFIDRCSPISEELLKDVENWKMNASISVASSTTEEHIYKSLTPNSEKKYQQQHIVPPHESPNEVQGQHEDLAWLSSSMNIKPFSKVSCSTKKHEKMLKCKFCSCVYKHSGLLKRHVYSAHKDKKIHKCCFCKRSFFFSINLKNHLKFHKKMTRLQKERVNRVNARKVKPRRTEERKSETKKKESKYEKYFIKIERDFTSLGVPVNFSCRLCFFGSSNPRIFIHHMKGHKEKPPYQCPQCDYSCISLSYMLNHMYWHAGYKLYKCRFCTFFSLYFASMVRHSYIHTRTKPYSCEFCQSTFTSTSGLKRHRRLHMGEEMCQGPQLDFVSEKKRTRRPSKSYTCDECNVLFYTKGHLSFHKKLHEQLKVTANDCMNESNKYKSKEHKIDSDPQSYVSVSLSDKGDHLTKEMCKMLAPTVDFEQAGDIQDSKEMYPGRTFTENNHLSNISPIFGSRSEVLDSYKMGTVAYKEEPLFSSETSHLQMQDSDGDAAYHKYKDMWPSSLSEFEMYKCQHCDYATAVHSNFKLHLKIHTDKGPFVCQECNKAFKTSNRLQKHKLLHREGQYEYDRYVCADNHLENLGLHHEMKIGMCPERDFCSSEGLNGVYSMLGSEVYGEQTDIKRDTGDLLAQSEPQFYQCVECQYGTYVLSNLKLHIRTHTGEKPYSCSVCQKTFRTSSHLKRHQVLHFSTERFKCRKCDYATNKWLSLKQHLTSHTLNESISAVCLFEQKPLPVKTYTCEECGYTTVHNGNFKQHLRIHTGEKPYKCGQCGGAFRTSSHLKRHLLTHLKLQCKKCGFSSVDKDTFQKHAKTHKKKKFKCSKCNVILSTKKLLENHKQQYHSGM